MDSAVHTKDSLYYGLAGVGVIYTIFIVLAKISNEKRRRWMIQHYRRASLNSITSAELITTIAELELQADVESKRGTLASILNWRSNKSGRVSEDWAFLPADAQNTHPLNFLKSKHDSKIPAAENTGAIPKRPSRAYNNLSPPDAVQEKEAIKQEVAAERAPSTSSCEEEDYLSNTPSQPIPQYCILENGVKITKIHNSEFVKPYTYIKSVQREKQSKGGLERVAAFILGKDRIGASAKSSESSLSRLFKFRSTNDDKSAGK